jgi:hypothetical protein
MTTDGSSNTPTDHVPSARDTALAVCVSYHYAGPPRYYFVLIFSLIPAAAQGVSDLLHNVTGYRVLYERDVTRIEALQKDGGLTVQSEGETGTGQDGTLDTSFGMTKIKMC